MDHRRPLAAGAAALLLLLPVGGCGGDDDGGGDGNHEDAGQEQPDGPTTTSTVQIGALTVTLFDGLPRDHVTGEVDYPQTPPVGGAHWEVWQECGFYDEPVRTEAAVHSLEHGAVWITYRPDLPADQVEQIRAYAEHPYVLASPWEDDSLPAPIVLTAWGVQMALESFPAPEADQFVTTYRAARAPEPDAPCTGGITLTAAEVAAELEAQADAG